MGVVRGLPVFTVLGFLSIKKPLFSTEFSYKNFKQFILWFLIKKVSTLCFDLDLSPHVKSQFDRQWPIHVRYLSVSFGIDGDFR